MFILLNKIIYLSRYINAFHRLGLPLNEMIVKDIGK